MDTYVLSRAEGGQVRTQKVGARVILTLFRAQREERSHDTEGSEREMGTYSLSSADVRTERTMQTGELLSLSASHKGRDKSGNGKKASEGHSLPVKRREKVESGHRRKRSE
jgi:hypothetical protein